MTLQAFTWEDTGKFLTQKPEILVESGQKSSSYWEELAFSPMQNRHGYESRQEHIPIFFNNFVLTCFTLNNNLQIYIIPGLNLGRELKINWSNK